MKNYNKRNNLGIYELCYTNLNYEIYKEKINKEEKDIFNKNYENKSRNKNKAHNSNEDIVANVSINVDHSNAFVNVKFKNQYESSENNTNSLNNNNSINHFNSGKNNNSITDSNANNEDYQWIHHY